jgi:hypothetical protein
VYEKLTKTYDPKKGAVATLFRKNFYLRLFRKAPKELTVKVPVCAWAKGVRTYAEEFKLDWHDRSICDIGYCNDDDMERYMLWNAVCKLPDRSQYIVKHRYGLFGAEFRTLYQMSPDLNLTIERIRQIEHLSINKVKKSIQTEEAMIHVFQDEKTKQWIVKDSRTGKEKQFPEKDEALKHKLERK